MKGLFFVWFCFMAGTCVKAQTIVFAQDTVPAKPEIIRYYTMGYGYGGIVAHNPQVHHLAQSHPWNMVAEYAWINGREEWSAAYKYPKVGIMGQYFNYQSPNVLGHSAAAVLYMEPRLWKRLSYRLGTGLVYNSRPFSLENNTTNLMLGSHLALVMHGQLSFYQPVLPSLHLRFSLGITHFSNGAYKLPNAGINNFYVAVAAQFGPKPMFGQEPGREPYFHATPKKRWTAAVSATGALVEKLPLGGPKYAVYHIHTRAAYRLGRKSSLLVGGDFAYNPANQAFLDQKPEFGTNDARFGLAAGHELHISKVSLVAEYGYYIIKNQHINSDFYQRYGLKYYLSPKLFTATYLKTHASKAECFEWGLGLILWNSTPKSL